MNAFRALIILMVVFVEYIYQTEGKNKDKYLLSKCSCSSIGKVDCDFSKLSKKRLLELVDKLSTSQIICVISDGIPIATFSKSLLNTYIPDPLIHSVDIQKQTGIQEKTIQSDSQCNFDGLSLSADGVQFMFPTTVVSIQLVRDKISQDYNEQLKEIMLLLEEENDGCTFNLHDGYRTKDGFLDLQEPSIQWLKSQIHAPVKKLLALTNSTNIPYSISGWGAVLRGTDSQGVHVHPGSIFAGVYYVTAPKEIGTLSKSHGCLRFHDPRAGAHMAQFFRGKNIYGDTFEVCPDTAGGFLILFPSWLMHEVKPMLPTFLGPRIAISFNIDYKP